MQLYDRGLLITEERLQGTDLTDSECSGSDSQSETDKV